MTYLHPGSPYTVGTAAVRVSPSSGPTNTYSIIIENTHATNLLYVGNSNSVTSSSYGVLLAAGASTTLNDLNPADQVWVIASAASTLVAVSYISR